MEEHDSDSIYSLITSLCEKFSHDTAQIKKTKFKCYEILLGKRFPKHVKKYRDLKGTADPYCNLLAWVYSLTNDYNLREHAIDLKVATDKLQEDYGSETTQFKSVLSFLLSLRNVPSYEDKKFDISALPVLDTNVNFNQLFKLPDTLLCQSAELSNSSFFITQKKVEEVTKTMGRQKSLCTCNSLPLNDRLTFTDINVKLKDEGYYSRSKSPDEEDIWELASKLEYSDRRNWENFGHPEPDKEKRFLTEIGDMSSLWVENLQSLYFVKMFRDGTVFRSNMKSKRTFMRDVKYLLVGMASDSFGFNEHGEFYLYPGICIEGITPDTLEMYCNDLMFCGTCYKALDKISTPNPETGKYRCHGYIFNELCGSINRYLQFYRTAALSLPDSTNFLIFHNETTQIRQQIITLTSICKVGPFRESEQMPNGVALLNYLYQQVLNLSDKNVLMVLYSVLYPCCQVYFSRFLQQWILEGSINDPYDEFFIKANCKYISTKGRTYWTRSYSLREDIVPDFLVDLRNDILLCGKTMNLLKYCAPSNKLCLYLMGKKPLIISCCLSSDQLLQLQQNSTTYYLEICSECGPKINFQDMFLKTREQDIFFLNLVSQKRAVTLKRLELERQKIEQEKREKRLEEISMLKEEYDAALQQKQSRIASEIQREIRMIEEIQSNSKIRDKLVQEEANNLIDYYSKLSEITEERKTKIDKHINTIKSIHMEHDAIVREIPTNFNETAKEEGLPLRCDSSNETFYSTDEPICEVLPEIINDAQKVKIHSSESMDIINANAGINETLNDNTNNNQVHNNAEITKTNEAIQQAIDNFALARKIKQKVMTEELGFRIFNNMNKTVPKIIENTASLTEAQKNKLRVLTQEFGIELKEKTKTMTALQRNKTRILGTDACFYGDFKMHMNLDNSNYLNRNITTKNEDSTHTTSDNASMIKKSKSLLLDFEKVISQNESVKPIPMSVDSTPLSDLPQITVTTPTSTLFSMERSQFDSMPTTADTQATDEGFVFDDAQPKSTHPIYIPDRNKSSGKTQRPVFSKRVSPEDASGISINCLKLFLHDSISIPLITQMALVNNELLKYFINDLKYLKHLSSLRDYFFLQDGEFGRNITENLFERLYDANFPIELINCRTLQHLVFNALDISNKDEENSQYLSFKINNLPKCFDLGDPDVLNCLSLTYKVKWPLNILLPIDTVAKYDEVFKYLVKLNRISWVLKKTFLELKILAKETGKKEIYLMMSPQYRRLHQCRHVMLHFIQTLQNYIVGEVLQPSWEMFERNLNNVTNLDELYTSHTVYIKNILFMCLLNQKTTILRNIIQKIFIVILKFYDYLRSRTWECVDGSYCHPNFCKLESIFDNFEEFVAYLFRVAKKVAKSGYQPHLIQLLDILNINGYYSKNINIAS